jgi:hypothetical protein
MPRVAVRANQRRVQTATGRSIPAPDGGWDAMNPIAAMPPTNAVILCNWIPRAGFVELRRGCIEWMPIGAPVETLMGFKGGATDKLFAAAAGKIYDVSATSGSPVLMLSGLGYNRWNYVSFSNPAGAWIVAANGVDAPIGYNAGAWAALPALSGTVGGVTLDPTKLFNVFSHKGRLFYLESNSLRVWNPAAGAVGGVCTLLDLSVIFNKGGRLVCGANWSAELGVTSDEYAIFVTDQGQVAVYSGIDPTSVSAWALDGVFDFGPPLGPRAFVQFGGDLALCTMDGVIPLSQGMQLDRAQQGNVAITRNIMQAFAQFARQYSNQVGWQGILTSVGGPSSPGGSSLAIFNVPTVTNQSAIQCVQNTLTGAWCKFIGQNALCYETAFGKLYFGGIDGVYQAGIGSSDNGQPIIGDVKGAFSAFGAPGRTKQFTMIRPILNTVPQVKPSLDIDVDYQESVPTAVPTVVEAGAAASQIRYEWTSAAGIGYVGAPRMQVNLVSDTTQPTLSVGDIPVHQLGIDATDGDDLLVSTGLPFDVTCQLLGFDIMFEPGGQL